MQQALALSGCIALAAGMIGTGVLCFVFASLDPQWQRPPENLDSAALAYANGAILIAASAALLLPHTAKLGGAALAAFLLLWAIVLNAPRVIAGEEAAWLTPAEVLAVAFGAWIVTDGTRGLRIIQMLFGLCAVTFGVAHFLYLEFTASMIPAFIPFHMFFVAFTGAGHIAAGAALVTGILAELGATLLGLMFACFVILLHIPRVLADPSNRIEWTMLCHATALMGAALLIAASLNHANAMKARNIPQE